VVFVVGVALFAPVAAPVARHFEGDSEASHEHVTMIVLTVCMNHKQLN
jgi:hypothetical protein